MLDVNKIGLLVTLPGFVVADQLLDGIGPFPGIAKWRNLGVSSGGEDFPELRDVTGDNCFARSHCFKLCEGEGLPVCGEDKKTASGVEGALLVPGNVSGETDGAGRRAGQVLQAFADRQSVLGFTWAFIPLLAQMVVFTVLFGNVAKLGPEGYPYHLFSLGALVPWTYFTRALGNTGNSLVAGRNLLSKVYFPRLVLPLTGVVGCLVDLAIGLAVLAIVTLCSGVIPGVRAFFLPVFILIAFLTALGFGLWLAALSVKYRDVVFATPFMLSIWIFLTPVVYAVKKIPAKYQVYLWLNPMTGVVEGFRWSLFKHPTPNWHYMGLSCLIVLVILISGLFFFRSMEKTFADII